jgi:hypothetical protein
MKINEILSVVRGRLENVLQVASPQAEDWVRLANAGAKDGGDGRDGVNKITISLVGVQADASTSTVSPPRMGPDERYYTAYPSRYLNLYIMIAADFTDENYEAGLVRLSSVISYFQQSPVLNRANSPDLPEDVEQLVVDFANLDFADVGHLMAAAGRKYAPAVFYRLRRLAFTGAVAGVAPPVTSVGGANVLPGTA